MVASKLSPSTLKYAQDYKYWAETAKTFFDLGQKQIDEALQGGDNDIMTVEKIADAWTRAVNAQWNLLKSGRQTCNRMALRRGVDNRQFHPAQLKKGEEVGKKVNKVLDGD